MNKPNVLSEEDRHAIIDTLEVFGIYSRETYEKFSDTRLIEEYDRIVGK